MSSAPKYNPAYTVDDYSHWQGDWELIDGVAISMSPSPFGPHQDVAAKILMQLMLQLKSTGCQHCHALYEIDWIVDRTTVVRPDILITCDGVPNRHVASPPKLIVEVLSKSTQQKDQTVKQELYAQRGVKYYLMADTDAKTLVAKQLVSDADSRYETLPPNKAWSFELHEDCSIELKASEIFPE